MDRYKILRKKRSNEIPLFCPLEELSQVIDVFRPAMCTLTIKEVMLNVMIKAADFFFQH